VTAPAAPPAERPVLDVLGTLPRDFTLVEASAGTGKTYSICALVLRLLVEENVPLESILVVTFTEAATADLRDRVRRVIVDALGLLLKDARSAALEDKTLRAIVERWPAAGIAAGTAIDRLRRALFEFDRASIHTIHGFCHRVLRECAFENGAPFSRELVTDPTPLLDEIAADYWVRETHALPTRLLRSLVSKGASLTRLRKLLRLVRAHARLRILPEAAERPALPDRAEVIEARAAFGALWRESGAAAMAMLREHKGLNRRSYALPTLDNLEAELVEYAARDADDGDTLPKAFQLLTSESLETKRNKGAPPPPEHPVFDAAARVLEATTAYDGAAAALATWLQRDFVVYAERELAARKRAQGLLTYDDLLREVAQTLRGPGGPAMRAQLRERYAFALIDEFQDTDPLQYEIFTRVFLDESGAARLLVVGDPKQAIYSFRGADVFTYVEAAAQARARFDLRQNWRSDPRLVAAINAVFGREGSRPFRVEGIDFVPSLAALERDRLGGPDGAPVPPLRVSVMAEDEAITGADWPLVEALADELVAALQGERRIDGDPLRPEQIAVLTRTNDQADMVQAALLARGVPCVQTRTRSVYSSQEARDLLSVLEAVAEPTRVGNLRVALATGLMGWRAAELAAADEDSPAWDAIVDDFRSWHEHWATRGFVPMMRRLIEERALPGRLLRYRGGERRLTNLLHLVELLHAVSREQGLGVAGVLRWLTEHITAAEDVDEHELRLESDLAAVQIVTAHRAKGLQYGYVFAPFLWKEVRMHRDEAPFPRFHDGSEGLTIDLRPEELDRAKGLAIGEVVDEAMRLTYVALTRAKHGCSVAFAHTSRASRSTLAELLLSELPGYHSKHTGAEVIAALEARAAASDGAIEVAPLLVSRREYRPPPSHAEDLGARPVTARTYRPWRVSSFSRLAASGASRGAEDADHVLDSASPEAEGHDLDSTAAAPPAEAPAPISVPSPLPLARFPGGTRAGTCLHALYEHLDFADAGNPALLEAAALKTLVRHGFDAELAPEVARSLGDVLATPLDAAGLRLADVARARRLDELAFLLPLDEARPLTGRALGATFAEHGGEATRALAEVVAELPFAALAGYLKGFVDLVFEHGGRWYLVDYKSNWLGDRPDDYGPADLQRAMLAHRYGLQYHLYLVALHRYLGQRLRGYDYDRDFGGVFYLFLRGMHPERGAATGVFADRPRRALVEALSALFAAPAAPAAPAGARGVSP
jgi:exodeoxyribonuclease V beta subunit